MKSTKTKTPTKIMPVTTATTPSTESEDKFIYSNISVDKFLSDFHQISELSNDEKWLQEFPHYPVYIRSEKMTLDEINDFIPMFTNQINDSLVKFTINDPITYFEYNGKNYILNGNTRYITLKHIIESLNSGVKEYEIYSFDLIPVRKLVDDTLIDPSFLIETQIKSNDSTNKQSLGDIANAANYLYEAELQRIEREKPSLSQKAKESLASTVVKTAFNVYVGGSRMKLSNLLAYGKFPDAIKNLIISHRLTVASYGILTDENLDDVKKGITYTTALELHRKYRNLEVKFPEQIKETDYTISAFIHNCVEHSNLSSVKNKSLNILFQPTDITSVFDMKCKEFSKDITPEVPDSSKSSAENLPGTTELLDTGDIESQPSPKAKKPLSFEETQKYLNLYNEFTNLDMSKLNELGLGAITQYQLINEIPVVLGKILNHPEFKITQDEKVIESVSENQEYYQSQLVVLMQLMNLILPVDKAANNPELFGKLLQDTKLHKIIGLWTTNKITSASVESSEKTVTPEQPPTPAVESVPELSQLDNLDSFI